MTATNRYEPYIAADGPLEEQWYALRDTDFAAETDDDDPARRTFIALHDDRENRTAVYARRWSRHREAWASETGARLLLFVGWTP